MELRQLRYFVAVAEEMHFGRAAEKLHVVQPALSRQVAALERELGFQLLERARRKVAFTPAGELFFHEAKESLQRIDRAVASAGMAARGELGSLAIGYVASAMWSVLPTILEAFLRERPGMSLDLEQLDGDVQLQRLRDGLLDVAFVRPPGLDDPLVATEPAWREPLLVALPAAHPLAVRDEIDLADLREETFLVPSRRRSRALHDIHISLFRQHGFSPRTIEANTPSALLLVSPRLAVALVPESLQRSGAPGVIFRPLRPPVPTLELVLAYRRTDGSPATHAFIEIARSVTATASHLARPGEMGTP